MELYKEVRRMHLDGVSQRQIATRLGISRNTVRKYLDGNVVPWEHKSYARPATALRPEVLTFIENCLETDRRDGTKKQYHTAKRIYDHLVAEAGFRGGESTIRAYVRALREKTREAFVPLVFQPGETVQIDWGKATIWLDGQRQGTGDFRP